MLSVVYYRRNYKMMLFVYTYIKLSTWSLYIYTVYVYNRDMSAAWYKSVSINRQ